MANRRKKTQPTNEPVPSRSSSSPVRVPDELLEEVDDVSALSNGTILRLTRSEVVEAAVRAGLSAVRERVEAVRAAR